MAKKPRKLDGEVRVKLLANDLKEGAPETIVRVAADRAEELIAGRQARRVTVDDFTFGKQAA